MNLKEWTKQSRGRQTSLASALGVSTPSVCAWVAGLKNPSVKMAVAIERHTDGAVTRKDLFPNDWQKIWPELATNHASAEGQGV